MRGGGSDREIRERGETFRRLASAANEGIAIVVGGEIAEANDAFARLFGYDIAEVIGRPPLDFVAPQCRETASAFVNAASERPHEVLGRRNGGATFDMELTTKSVPFKNESALGFVVRDISERKEIERLKNEFVSVVSHELRTPLTSIRGSLGLIEGGAVGELPEKARDLVRIARQNADRLIRLVNDILDLEKIQSGKLQLEITALDPEELVECTIAELRGLAQQYDVSIVVGVRRADRVAGDRDRIVQVLTNLLSNAVKFSPAGSLVTVSLLEGEPGYLRFTVQDEGPGIPEDQRARLFGRFVQLEPASTRRRGGTGLGLAISRSLVEQHGGRIGVESSPGWRRGSEFWFELPLVTRDEDSGAPRDASREAPAVLVVEDEAAVARVLEIVLRHGGHEVTIAGSVGEARALLARLVPAAIVLDMNLPDGSGLDLLEQLGEQHALARVPVVVLSGAAPAIDDRNRNARVVEWVMKPFSSEELLRALRGAMAA